MKMRGLFAIVVLGSLVLLGGCDVDTRPSPQQTASDQARCEGYGYQPGTNRFADCMMSTTNDREAREDQQKRDAARWRERQNREYQKQQDRNWAQMQSGNKDQDSQADKNCTSTTTSQQTGNTTTTRTSTKCH